MDRSDHTRAHAERDLLGDTLYMIFGAAELGGAEPLAGHSPEAREAWRRRLEARRRERENRRRTRAHRV
jgi:hypothetical protein